MQFHVENGLLEWLLRTNDWINELHAKNNKLARELQEDDWIIKQLQRNEACMQKVLKSGNIQWVKALCRDLEYYKAAAIVVQCGHLAVLMWLAENTRVPFNPNLITLATKANRPDILLYLLMKGIPGAHLAYNNALKEAQKEGHEKCLALLLREY